MNHYRVLKTLLDIRSDSLGSGIEGEQFSEKEIRSVNEKCVILNDRVLPIEGISVKDLDKCIKFYTYKAKQEFDKLHYFMEMLEFADYNMDYQDFINVFGQVMGDHLWNKFLIYERDLLNLYSSLDYSNRIKFLDLVFYVYINKRIEIQNRLSKKQ